ncbi:kinase-like domain-containing protein [Annulohypoxylon moriforme]|nr:kinase-like domain-containing protein [Annulohypoxylon moriforme]
MEQQWGESGFIFPQSQYFTNHKSSEERILPSPAQVRAAGRDPTNPATCSTTRPPPVKIPSLALLVKYGSQVSIAEAECLILVRKYLPSVPVPEVYGWCEDDKQTFIYMELVEGRTLEDSWGQLSEEEKVSICSELRNMANAWRELPQRLFSDAPFVGHIGKRPLSDWIFINSCAPTAGPFEGVSQFHDWFTSSFGRTQKHPDLPRQPHPYRSQLPDDAPITFTHADLHPSNIIVSRLSSDATRVVSVVDWQQAGWYPAYWEYCKSRWSWSDALGDSWANDYLPLILEHCTCYDYWDYFVGAYGM